MAKKEPHRSTRRSPASGLRTGRRGRGKGAAPCRSKNRLRTDHSRRRESRKLGSAPERDRLSGLWAPALAESRADPRVHGGRKGRCTRTTVGRDGARRRAWRRRKGRTGDPPFRRRTDQPHDSGSNSCARRSEGTVQGIDEIDGQGRGGDLNLLLRKTGASSSRTR